MKMSFDVEISDWARYVAQNKNGEWWAYISTPKLSFTQWNSSQSRVFLVKTARPEDFTKELYLIIR